MNKAFVREPDAGDERCPQCGAIGLPVQRETIARHVTAGAASQIAETANFCQTPLCPVVYFDLFERAILVDALLRPIYPKQPDAPLCACFGLTRDDIDQDLAEGVNRRTKACVLRAQSAEARCQELAPSGRSCVAEVQRYFMQRRRT